MDFNEDLYIKGGVGELCNFQLFRNKKIKIKLKYFSVSNIFI